MHDLHLSMAPDTGLSLAERLDRFDEKREREVGDTDLLRARNLERETGLHQIYLKFEGGNPTGTQKDRIAFAQVGDALRRGFETVCAATCGNYGVAVALAGRLAGLKVHVTFPATYTGRRVKELEELGAQITRAGADYEEAVLASRAHASSIEGYDANPGGANAALQLKAYGEIAWEIYDVLRDAPRAVAVPVSNGSTLAGVHKGFVSLHRRGKTSRIPIVVAGSAAHQNPIVESWQKKLETCVDLDPAKIHETRTNEPLINWQALDGEAALEAVYGTKGWAGDVSDRKMQKMARLLREVQGLDVLPAATAGLVALLDAHAESPLPEDRYVVVLTGRNA